MAHGFNFLDTRFRRALQKKRAQFNINGPWRLPSVAYTLEHKLAFLEREHYVFGRYTRAGLFHDCDKLIMYLLPGFTSQKTNNIHTRRKPHHLNKHTYKISHLLEAFIDWDCAALTKPDKPLNPWEVLVGAHPNKMVYMLPVCLAVRPEIITTTFLDVPERNKKFFPDYPFADPAKAAAVFDSAKATLKSIADNLPTEENFASTIPQSTDIHQMTPAELFLQMVLLLAGRRRETINYKTMCQTIWDIQTRFNTVTHFTVLPPPTTPIPLQHHPADKMPHPFIGSHQHA